MNEKKNMRLRVASALLATVALAGAAVGTWVWAKYASENRRQTEISASEFHISSDYLEASDTPPTYNAYAPVDGIRFQLNNYEKDNVALISQVAISYTITVKLGEADITDKFYLTANDNTPKPFSGIMPVSSDKADYDFWLRPKADDTFQKGDTCTVIVKTTEPYEKTLSATFVFQNSSHAEISVQREAPDIHGDRYVVTIASNAYSGDLTVSWPAGLVPDTTNPHMESWSGSSGTMTVEAYTGYTLIFFNPTHITYTGTDNSFTIEHAN